MEGYRTIVANSVALLASIAILFGVEIGLEAQSAIVMLIMSLGGIAFRFITKTPIPVKLPSKS